MAGEFKEYRVDHYTTTFHSRSKRVNAISEDMARKMIEELPDVAHVTAIWECKWRRRKILGDA